jgi:hypothetical protein
LHFDADGSMAQLLLIAFIVLQMSRLLNVVVSAQAQSECRKPVVAIYAGRSYHDEVTASIACLFFVMGYEVVVYADDRTRMLGFTLPVTNMRIANSITYYGRCVHRWIPITPYVQLVSNVTTLAIVSYPMKIDHHTPDEIAYGLIRQMVDNSSATKLLLITHRAKANYWTHLAKVTQYVPPTQIAFLFLAEHVHNTALGFHPDNGTLFRTGYIHPTVPLKLLFDGDRTTELIRNPAEATPAAAHNTPPSYAIQGHFGGRHTKRRSVPAVTTCLNALAASFNCSDVAAELNLMGRGTAKTGRVHHRVRVRRHRDLRPLDFHQAVAQSAYLLTATGTNDAYDSAQATSTVPLALTLQLPLVGKRSLLGRYPCLRESELLMALTGETDCDAIQRAMQHSAEQYVAARQAMAACAAQLWRESIGSLQILLSSLDGPRVETDGAPQCVAG